LSFATQIITADKRLYCRSIFWTIAYHHPHLCTPCELVENASDCCQGNFPHAAYYPLFRSNFPHIPVHILPSAIPHFTNSPLHRPTYAYY